MLPSKHNILDLDETVKEVSPDEQASSANTVPDNENLGWYDLHFFL